MDDLVEQLYNLRPMTRKAERSTHLSAIKSKNQIVVRRHCCRRSSPSKQTIDSFTRMSQTTERTHCVMGILFVSLTNTGSTNMGPSVWLPAWAGKWLKCGIRILASYARGHGGISSGSKHQKGTNRREHLNDNTTCVAATQSNDVTTKYEYKYHTSTTSAGPRVQFISHHIQHPAADEEYIVRHI